MKKRNLYFILFGIVIFIVSSVIFAFLIQYINEDKYNKALFYFNNNDYIKASELYSKLGRYRDSEALNNEVKEYIIALEYYNNKNYEKALEIFQNISKLNINNNLILDVKYNLALQYCNDKDYEKSKQLFLELDDYEDSETYLDEIDKIIVVQLTEDVYIKACKSFENEDYEKALSYFKSIDGYKDSKKKAKECKKQIKRRNLNNTISAGNRHTVAILSNGNAIAVGDRDDNRCDLQDFKNMVSIAAGGTFTIGFDEDGKVKIAGRYDDHLKVDTNKNKWKESKFIDVAAGQQFVVGLTTDGKIVADGHKDDGQIDFKGWNKEKFIAIDAGWRFTVGLTENKELKFSGIYGNQYQDFLNHKDEWKDVVNISAAGGDTKNNRGSGHTVGLRSDGTVVAVGGDDYWKQCDVKEWKDIVKVVAGDWYTVGLKANGQVLITGENKHENHTEYIDNDLLNEINKKSDIVDIATGYGQTIFVHEDGSISAFAFDKDQETDLVLQWEDLKIQE